jgi:hypothetical protein
MAIKDDIAVDSSGNFYYTGAAHGAAGAGYYTVIEFHRYAQDLADDATAAGDDLVDITSETPSDRSTDNIISLETGYRLDDANGSATDAISELRRLHHPEGRRYYLGRSGCYCRRGNGSPDYPERRYCR